MLVSNIYDFISFHYRRGVRIVSATRGIFDYVRQTEIQVSSWEKEENVEN